VDGKAAVAGLLEGGKGMIPVKLFQKMLDLEAETYELDSNDETIKELLEFQDKIGFPWKMSQEQIDYRDSLVKIWDERRHDNLLLERDNK
jgi:hypothetical protein